MNDKKLQKHLSKTFKAAGCNSCNEIIGSCDTCCEDITCQDWIFCIEFQEEDILKFKHFCSKYCAKAYIN